METEPEFDKFWEYYPKKKSKGEAYKAWLQTKRPALATILKAIVVLKNSGDWLRDGGKWIPYPATWIRAWGWDDVADADKADVRGNEMWWATTSGIEAKGKELGLEWDAVNGELFTEFRDRVKEEALVRKVVPLASVG